MSPPQNSTKNREYEDSAKAQAGLASKLPVIGILILLIVISLFNSLRKPLVIFLMVPLAVIGVTVGLLSMNQPFGFMALLGFMSLVGMLIKNAIVLVDEIGLQASEGKDPYHAVVDSGLSRCRPVSMAATTTVLGMIPLVPDAFFVSMAVTIMFGLTFATALTLVVMPVLYTVIFNIKSPK
nr:efflux RND transporter permease subunit [Pontiella sulfatireligans]